MKVVVCDDNQKIREQWAANLRKLLDHADDVESFDKLAMTETIKSLVDRRRRWREKGEYADIKCRIDDCDVLILDYDLLTYFDEAAFLTGDEVAYLARAFSKVGYVVVLNQFGTNEFDLTMVQDRAAHADLCAGAIQIQNPGLWSSGPFEGYRPWHWPNLRDAAKQFRDAAAEGARAIDTPIKEFFRFSDGEWASLPPSALAYLELRAEEDEQVQNGVPLVDVTLRQFALKSHACLERRDAPGQVSNEVADVLARIATARLRKWLERYVMPVNSALVDLPHLLMRLPGLVPLDAHNPDGLSGYCRVTTSAELPGGLERHRFARKNWVERAAYRWQSLNADADLMKAVTLKVESPDAVFAEDVSRFVAFAQSRDFLCALEDVDQRRYVSRPTKTDKGSALDTTQVRYLPLSLLAV